MAFLKWIITVLLIALTTNTMQAQDSKQQVFELKNLLEKGAYDALLERSMELYETYQNQATCYPYIYWFAGVSQFIKGNDEKGLKIFDDYLLDAHAVLLGQCVEDLPPDLKTERSEFFKTSYFDVKLYIYDYLAAYYLNNCQLIRTNYYFKKIRDLVLSDEFPYPENDARNSFLQSLDFRQSIIDAIAGEFNVEKTFNTVLGIEQNYKILFPKNPDLNVWKDNYTSLSFFQGTLYTKNAEIYPAQFSILNLIAHQLIQKHSLSQLKAVFKNPLPFLDFDLNNRNQILLQIGEDSYPLHVKRGSQEAQIYRAVDLIQASGLFTKIMNISANNPLPEMELNCQ